MKTKKIILLIITLALVCVAGFSGLVSAFAETGEGALQKSTSGFGSVPTVRGEYVDGMFPAFTETNYYLILDFTDANIPLDDLGYIFFNIKNFGAVRIDNYTNVDYVYCLSFPKAAIPVGNYTVFLDLINISSSLNEIGYPAFSYIEYFDINNNRLNIPSLTYSYTATVQVLDTISYIVITFDNPINTLRIDRDEIYQNWVDAEYRESLLQGDITELESQLAQRDEQLAQKEDEYWELYNDWEEERDSKEHFQDLLKEANNRIDQLENIIDEQPVAAGFGFITYAFQKVGEILAIELLPGISVGLLALIPLVLGVVFFVLRLIRGE